MVYLNTIFSKCCQIQNESFKNSGYNYLKRASYGDENLVFYPISLEEIGSAKIKYINLAKTIENENPFCIKNVDGKVKLRLKKDFADALVTVTKA